MKKKKVFRLNIRSLPVDTVTFKEAYYKYALIARNASYIEPHKIKSLRNIITRTIKQHIKGSTFKEKKKKTFMCMPIK